MNPCKVLAELGLAHGGSLERALSVTRAHAKAGAWGIKVQAFRFETLYAPGSVPREGEELFRTHATPYEWFPAIARAAREAGAVFAGTPFDDEAVSALAAAGAAAIKIASGDVTNTRLLSAVARSGLPVILSTGASTMDEVRAAVATLDRAGASDVTILQCVSAYPCSESEAALDGIGALAALGHPVGYSDHTIGIAIAIEAARRGAVLVEKHVTDSRARPGPDQELALEPDETRALVAALARTPIGTPRGGEKRVLEIEAPCRIGARRSLYTARDLPAGHILAADDVVVLRPAKGLGADFDYVGRTLPRPLEKGVILLF